jgi:hypothetical protein
MKGSAPLISFLPFMQAFITVMARFIIIIIIAMIVVRFIIMITATLRHYSNLTPEFSVCFSLILAICLTN